LSQLQQQHQQQRFTAAIAAAIFLIATAANIPSAL